MMNFVATVAGSGLAAVVVVANLSGGPLPTETTRAGATMIDPVVTNTISAPAVEPARHAIRMIDLRSGATCRIAAPAHVTHAFTSAPIGPDCQGSPALSQVSQWRKTDDGTLEMANEQNETILRFMPGDGVLYESIFPSEALVTIVTANG